MSQTDATQMKQDTLRQETADINALRWGKLGVFREVGGKKSAWSGMRVEGIEGPK